MYVGPRAFLLNHSPGKDINYHVHGHFLSFITQCFLDGHLSLGPSEVLFLGMSSGFQGFLSLASSSSVMPSKDSFKKGDSMHSSNNYVLASLRRHQVNRRMKINLSSAVAVIYFLSL